MWTQVQLAGHTEWILPAPYFFFDSAPSAALMAGYSLIGVIVFTIGYHSSPRLQNILLTRRYTPQRHRGMLLGITLVNLLFLPLIALQDFLVWVVGYPDYPLLPYPLGWLLILGTLAVCWSPYLYIYLREKLE